MNVTRWTKSPGRREWREEPIFLGEYQLVCERLDAVKAPAAVIDRDGYMGTETFMFPVRAGDPEFAMTGFDCARPEHQSDRSSHATD